MDTDQLVMDLQAWGRDLGFSQIGVAPVDLSSAEPGLLAWLGAGHHGEMDYMARHGLRRARPSELVPGTLSVLTARMNYLPRQAPTDWAERERLRLLRPQEAVISVYARGRDYHKLMRQRLQRLAERLVLVLGPLGYRVFTDSAPVLEVELASRSGQGWRGKHTLLLNTQGGSMFFLGEIYLDLALPPTPTPLFDMADQARGGGPFKSMPAADDTRAAQGSCGSCSACISACPTQAILGPYRLDARRCISYLTIEHPGAIPEGLRPAMGNRIYGCDDCQLVCPWNKFAQRASLPDFDERLGPSSLLALWAWDEADFLRNTEGSAIRRIGHVRWLRNLAVAMGNALRARPDAASDAALRAALGSRLVHPSSLVQEHVRWALAAPVSGV